MRSMLLSVMFCLISSVSWAMLHSSDTTLWTDFVENPSDGLVYKKFQATPFTGVVMATPDDPVQRSYQDGVKHGEWVEFDANGLVKTKSEFEHGKVQKIVGFENGEETILEEYKYYENGQLKSKWNFKDGKEHGLLEGYHKNGQLEFKWNYKDGRKNGLQESYYKNGELEYQEEYKNGKLYKNGQLASGLFEYFYEGGQLKRKIRYKEAELHGPQEFYYENGQLKWKWNYKDGKEHGLQKGYYRNGQLRYKTNYKNGVEIKE